MGRVCGDIERIDILLELGRFFGGLGKSFVRFKVLKCCGERDTQGNTSE